MAVKTFAVGELVTASDANTYLANSGLVYVKSQTVGTGVSSVTVTDAFSAEYENYLITLSGGTMSASTAIRLQLSGVTSGYYGSFVYADYTISGAYSASDNNTAGFTYFGGGDSGGCGGQMTLLAPNKSIPTRVSSSPIHYGNNFGSYVGAVGGGAVTGFSLNPFTGTLTGGTITVYGYRKA